MSLGAPAASTRTAPCVQPVSGRPVGPPAFLRGCSDSSLLKRLGTDSEGAVFAMVGHSGRSNFLAPSGASEGVAPSGAHPGSDMAVTVFLASLQVFCISF